MKFVAHRRLKTTLRRCAAALFIGSAALFLLSIPCRIVLRDASIGQLEIANGRADFIPRHALLDDGGGNTQPAPRSLTIERSTNPPQWSSGFVWWFDQDGYTETLDPTALPLWMPAATGLLAFAITFLPARRPPNTCRRCRYPLAGLAPDARCPECGTQHSHQRLAAVSPHIDAQPQGPSNAAPPAK